MKVNIIGFLFILCFGSLGYLHTNNSVKSKEFSSVSAEWAEEASSPKELFEKSDIVVVGETKATETIIQPFPDVNSDIVYSLYDFDVKYVLKGDTDINSIPLINYGGETTDGKEVIFEGIENLTDNNLYLFFLNKLPDSLEDGRAGKYRPVDGPSGVYKINSTNKILTKNIKSKEELDMNILNDTDLKLFNENPVLEIQLKMQQLNMSDILKISDSDR